MNQYQACRNMSLFNECKMLIIFDCDGVLRSVSWDAMYEAYLAISEYINKDPTNFWKNATDFRRWHDNDWHYNLERMGATKKNDYSVISQIFHDIYDPCIIKFSWVEEVLAYLAQKQHVLTILSGAKFNSVCASLDTSVNYFSIIKGSDQVRKIKPNPEGIDLIMDETGVGVADTVMIGDSEADILAGKNAGVRTVGVTWGMSNLATMKKLQPDYIFQDPMQLKSF